MKVGHRRSPGALVVGMVAVLAQTLAGCDDSDGDAADGGLDAAGGGGGADGGGDVGIPLPTANCTTLTTTSTLAESIDADQTWRGAVAVTGAVRVNAAKITIEPGTTLVMGADASIEFGWNSNTASVFARGTSALPIRVCGKQATAGYWNRLVVGNKVTSDSVFENVVITEGGQMTGAALILNAPVLVSGVNVGASGADGVHAVDFKAGSASMTVSGAAKVPVALLESGAATRLPIGGTFTGNGTNHIAVRFDATEEETTFKDAGVPYLQEASVQVRAPVKVTFEAGVDYRLAVDTVLEIGWNSNASTLAVNGTMDRPVRFGRASETAGRWKTLIIGAKVRSDSVLSHVEISGGGNGGPAVDLRSGIIAKNVTLKDNQVGLNVDGPGFGAGSTALTITSTMAAPATVDLASAVTLPRGGAFTGNTNDWIVIDGGDLAGVGTLANLGVPYRIEGNPQTTGQSSLTIEAGTTFLMGPDSDLEFGWNSGPSTIVAVGTAAAPIVFKGADDVAGYWSGLVVGTMVASSSKLHYLQVSNGGKATGSALRLLKANFDVKNSSFSKSLGWGIEKGGVGDTTDYTAPATGNTFDMNALGPVSP